MKHRAGDRVPVQVTWLEMTERPSYPRPHMPGGTVSALVAAEAPPPWYFLALYDAVGSDYDWTDQHERSETELAEWLADDRVTLWTFLRAGWPQGFFLLDCTGGETCNLAYFGLVPDAVGQGLGTYLLETAVHTAWDMPGMARVTVDTNSLDHPRALPLYQKAGFTPVRRETVTRTLTRDRTLIGV